MLSISIYFNSERFNEHIRIDNVIMCETISNELVILYKVESYNDNYTEIKRYPMSIIDYYLVGYNK